jgi:tellurite resistance protein TerC
MPSNSARRVTFDPLRPPRDVTAWVLRHLKRVIITVVGATVLLIGIAMIVLPGPAFVVIPLGLGILALEFAWAERMLRRLKTESGRVLGRK